MQHSFDIEIAKKYGILEAVLLNHLDFWTRKNMANGDNYYDGHTWTYNSMKAFAELFPYVSERQLRYAINHLLKEELIIKGNYNKLGFDRTLWYALTEKYYKEAAPFDKIVKCNRQNCQIKMTPVSNQNDASVKPIPDKYSYIDTDINTSASSAETEVVIPLKDGGWYVVPEADIEQYKQAYPNIDVRQELVKAVVWCSSNPSKQKTRSGIKRFINGWLNRATPAPAPPREKKSWLELADD